MNVAYESPTQLVTESDPAPVSSTLPITLPNGERWYGLTEPPEETDVRHDHPRLMVNSSTLGALRKKLADPVYAADVAAVRADKNATTKAFCYLVWGDEDKGREAIDSLMNWNFARWDGLESRGGPDLQAILMYDWLYNLMTQQQREKAQAVLRANLTPIDTNIDTMWHSDKWGRTHGQFSILEALTVDNDWSMDLRSKMRDPDYRGFKVYRGALDILTQMACQNGGGWHAGQTQPVILAGYEAGFAYTGGPWLLRGWETATGEPLFSRTTYFDKLPYDLVKVREPIYAFQQTASHVMEICTGVNSPESASLAKWLLEKYGRINNHRNLPLRLLVGDLRVKAKSPDELGISLWGYQDGANSVYVRSGWQDTATHFLFTARHWDRGRYEQASGQIAIHKNRVPVLPLSNQHKSVGHAAYTQLRVWNPNGRDQSSNRSGFPQQGNTYWQKPHGDSSRAATAADVVDQRKPWHRPETLTQLSESGGIITATTRFDRLLKVATPRAERTVVIDPVAETVLVRDYAELAEGLQAESNFGLHEEPLIAGNVIENSRVRITVQSDFNEIVWDVAERENDHRGGQWTVGTVKIRPKVVRGLVDAEMLLEVK